MKAKLTTLGVAAVLCAPAISLADTTLYGKAHLAVESEGDSGSITKVKSHASRVGIKGKKSISDGLTAVYKFEWQIDMTDKSKASDNHIKSRNMYAGLSGALGTIIVGRHDTPLKISQGKFDQFNDIYADVKRHFSGETRADNVIGYLSPKFNGVQIIGAYVPIGNTDNDSIISIAGIYAGKNLFASLAYNRYDEGIDVGNNLVRTTMTYKFSNFGVGGMYQTAEPATGDSTNAFAVNSYFKSGENKFKIQFQEGEGQAVGVKTAKIKEDANTISIGWYRGLNKHTKIYLAAHSTNFDASGKNDFTNIGTGFVLKF